MAHIEDTALRQQLLQLLREGGAHLTFDDAIDDFPEEYRGRLPERSAHTGWQILEHMRIAQWDILEFCRNPKHVSPDFPGGYWPSRPEPGGGTAWNRSIEAFRSGLADMCELVKTGDLFAEIDGGDRQTLLREALLVADHNSYHLGELVALRRQLGIWE